MARFSSSFRQSLFKTTLTALKRQRDKTLRGLFITAVTSAARSEQHYKITHKSAVQTIKCADIPAPDLEKLDKSANQTARFRAAIFGGSVAVVTLGACFGIAT
ncbi:uncharacterized protein B0H64DRAFT_441383 [Chaetomium fimeti]|uniref:Uncharacterized protein n=1 Tax=Chaetomium fimeti TaxID=1854472 RepID=A0AAE0LV47_9PEZI|nr:hypothetical protein B0H64DRAFT_441383 [Chaetomium fimeti]